MHLLINRIDRSSELLTDFDRSLLFDEQLLQHIPIRLLQPRNLAGNDLLSLSERALRFTPLVSGQNLLERVDLNADALVALIEEYWRTRANNK